MLPNPLHALEIHYMLPNSLHGISRPAQTGTALAPRHLTRQLLPLALPGLALDHPQYLRPKLT